MEASIEKLHQVFKTMVYGENTENTSQAKAWLEDNTILDKSSDVDILNNVKPYKPQQSHLLRLAEELEKNSALISQIELLCRGVLTKDTKQAVHNLAQYFYYYACFVEENEDAKELKTAVGVFEDDHPLWVLGLFLGPALATGHSAILQVGTKFGAVVRFILNLAAKIGIPKESVQLLPSYSGHLDSYFLAETVSVVSLFIDVFDDKYAVSLWNKKALIRMLASIDFIHRIKKKRIETVSRYKSPMLVFDSADLDSAVDSAIEGTWGYQGMLPWALDTVLVQENVFKTFVDKLKIRLESVRIGNDRLADISVPNNPNIRLKLSELIRKAQSLGIEVYQKVTDEDFTPTLIIGSRVNTNNVVSSPDVNCALTLLPFRSIDEGVNLANNGRQGLGVSVWSENIGLLNEVAIKLKAGNVWLNCHGHFCPTVAFTPLKDSGTGYFGGKQGLIEFKLKSINKVFCLPASIEFKSVDAIKSCIDAGHKAGSAWSKVATAEKLKIFLHLLDFLQTNQKKFSGQLPESWINSFIINLHWVMKQQTEGTTLTLRSFIVNAFKIPKGVLAIAMNNPLEKHHVILLLVALLTGNAVLLLNETAQAQAFYQELSKKLPGGLLSVIPYSDNAILTCSKHKELNGYYTNTPLNLSNNFIYVPEHLYWEQLTNLVTASKNVWSNVGQSSQCNL